MRGNTILSILRLIGKFLLFLLLFPFWLALQGVRRLRFRRILVRELTRAGMTPAQARRLCRSYRFTINRKA